ncbi:replication-relaxation family protein [Priestia megaterium]
MMKHIVLSEQDRQLLLHLHKFIYLSKEFIETYIYNDPREPEEARVHERTVYRRINKIEEAGYITSFSVPIKPNSKRPSYIFTLTKLGVDMIKELIGDEDAHWKPAWSQQPPLWYMHTLNLAEVVKSFEYNGPTGVVKEFVSEERAYYKYMENDKEHVIRPDGILILGQPHHNDENFGIMIEMERSYASRSGTIRKLEQYNRFFEGYIPKGREIEESKEAKFKKYENRMKKFDMSVGFEYPVNIRQWLILFIGDNETMGQTIFQKLRGLKSTVPLLSAYKGDLLKTPYGEVYRDMENPDKLSGL